MIKTVVKHAEIKNESTHKYRDDCTIQALANGLNISYDFALSILQRVQPTGNGGYVISSTIIPKNKFSTTTHYQSLLRLFANEEQLRPQSTFYHIKEKKGTYIVLQRSHALVLHNGVAVDVNFKKSVEVKYIYRIYASKVNPFLNDVAEQLRISVEDHKSSKTLGRYINSYDKDEVIKNIRQSVNQDEVEFAKNAEAKGIDPKIFGTTVKIDGKSYKVVRINNRNRKYPIIVECETAARTYKISKYQYNTLAE